jgi:hypothetical protein
MPTSLILYYLHVVLFGVLHVWVLYGLWVDFEITLLILS